MPYLPNSGRLSKTFLLLVLLAGGCATQAPPSKQGIKEAWAQTDGVQYRCDANRSFVASFAPDGSRAAIKLGEVVYEVPQVESGSGVHYKSDEIEFIGKGRDAELLQSPDGVYEACRVVQ